MNHNLPSNRLGSAGAAMVELALTLPFLLFLFAAVLETGRAVEQIVWAGNTAYQLALVLGSTQREIGEDYMWARYSQITGTIRDKQYPSLGLGKQNPEEVITPVGADYYDDADRTVKLSLLAHVQAISNSSFSIPLKISVVSPNLIPETGQFGQAKNPDVLYDCCGLPGASTGQICAQPAVLCALPAPVGCVGVPNQLVCG